MRAHANLAPSIQHIAFGVLMSMNLSARLLQLRKQHDWTQHELAAAAGIHVNQVRRYEAGTAQPSLDVLKSLARVFVVSTDSLLFDENERGPSEDLRLQFEALSTMSAEDQHVARAVLDAMIVKSQVAGALERVSKPAVSTPATPAEPAPRPAAKTPHKVTSKVASKATAKAASTVMARS